jgi:hypothetical protein
LNSLKFQIFKHGTLFFSRDTPNISTVIPAMDHIDEYMATASQNLDYSEATRAALALGKRTLNRYYDKTDHSEVYRIAMGTLLPFFHKFFRAYYSYSVLHPRHKLNYFKKAGWDDAWIETAHGIVRAEFDQTYAFMDINAEPSRKATRKTEVSYLLYLRPYY